MSEQLAKLEKKGGGSVDISDLEAGYAQIAFSSAGVRGTYNIASSTYSSGTSISNNVIISGFANVKGYANLRLTSNNACNYIVYGIKSDGTVTLVANRREGTTLDANVTDYEYAFFAVTFYGGTNVTARLS